MFFGFYEYVILLSIVFSKTTKKYAFRRYKDSKRMVYHFRQCLSMIFITSLCNSASHQIFFVQSNGV